MRRIWRNLIPLIALVANTWPLEPSVNTTIDATTTIKSGIGKMEVDLLVRLFFGFKKRGFSNSENSRHNLQYSINFKNQESGVKN
jgi:hypothetical protein